MNLFFISMLLRHMLPLKKKKYKHMGMSYYSYWLYLEVETYICRTFTHCWSSWRTPPHLLHYAVDVSFKFWTSLTLTWQTLLFHCQNFVYIWYSCELHLEMDFPGTSGSPNASTRPLHVCLKNNIHYIRISIWKKKSFLRGENGDKENLGYLVHFE